MSTKMYADTITGEIRRCYKLAMFPRLDLRRDQDGSVAVFSSSGKFLKLFVNMQTAQHFIERAQKRCVKDIPQ